MYPAVTPVFETMRFVHHLITDLERNVSMISPTVNTIHHKFKIVTAELTKSVKSLMLCYVYICGHCT